MKKCVLEEKECVSCGRCEDRCELDPTKICDNCFRCLELDDRAYVEIPIAGVYTEEDYVPEEPVHAEQARFLHIQTLYGLYAERRRRC